VGRPMRELLRSSDSHHTPPTHHPHTHSVSENSVALLDQRPPPPPPPVPLHTAQWSCRARGERREGGSGVCTAVAMMRSSRIRNTDSDSLNLVDEA
jgi:hypothetical protein